MQRAYWETVANMGGDGINTEYLCRLAVEGGWLYKLKPTHGPPSITFVPRISDYAVLERPVEFRPQTENVLDADVPM